MFVANESLLITYNEQKAAHRQLRRRSDKIICTVSNTVRRHDSVNDFAGHTLWLRGSRDVRKSILRQKADFHIIN